jgi:radical SAM protein with 4Fe4S-binding SPASM domain
LPSLVYHLPEHIKLETTTRCNLLCQFCGRTYEYLRAAPGSESGEQRAGRANSSLYGANMPFEQFRVLLEQFPTLRSVDIQGTGEPLFNPGFVCMLDYCKRRKIDVEFFTNGTLLKPRIARKILGGSTRRLTISIDAATPSLFEEIRVGARYHVVIDNVRAFMKLRRERQQATPRVRVMMVIAANNVHEIADVVLLCSQLGVDELVISRINVPGPELSGLACDETSLWTEIDRAFRVADECGLVLKSEIILLQDHKADTAPQAGHGSKCLWPWYSANILVDGSVTPCPFISYAQDMNMGNAFEQDFLSVWNGLPYRHLRHAHRTRHLADTPCATCHNYTI